MNYKRTTMQQFHKIINRPIVCAGVSRYMDAFCQKLGDDSWKKHIMAFIDNNQELQGSYIEVEERKIPVFGFDYLKGCRNINLLITAVKPDNIESIVRQIDMLEIDSTVNCYCMLQIEEENMMDDSSVERIIASENKSLIEKNIHCFWFSEEEKPKKYQDCIDSWRRYCSDYRFLEWNAANYDIEKNNYMKQAFEKKRWALASDYARLDVVYQFGGIYFDMDVELLKNIDRLLKCKAFFSMDMQGYIDLGSGFGAQKNLPFLKELMGVYDGLSYNPSEKWGEYTGEVAQPHRLLEVFEAIGYKKRLTSQVINNMCFLSPNYFRVIEDSDCKEYDLKGNEYGIHWHYAGWKDSEWAEERKVNLGKKKDVLFLFDSLCKR